jgi:dephospho-CoA kinase
MRELANSREGGGLMHLLLTGMSGTGKSSVVRALRERGIEAVDTDDGWCIVQPDGTQRWNEPKIAALLDDTTPDALVLAGCEENMVGFLPRFDVIVLLSAPTETILARIETRTNNDFGKSAEERQRILDDIATVEPLLRRAAHHEIDTTQPLDDVVDRVVELLRGA